MAVASIAVPRTSATAAEPRVRYTTVRVGEDRIRVGYTSAPELAKTSKKVELLAVAVSAGERPMVGVSPTTRADEQRSVITLAARRAFKHPRAIALVRRPDLQDPDAIEVRLLRPPA